MPSPTMTRGLLGILMRGADLLATDQHATTQPILLPTSSALWAILAAGAGGRSVQGGVSGRKGPRGGRGRMAGKGGRNRAASRQDGDGDEDDGCEEEDDGGTGAWRTGPDTEPGSGKH